MHTLIDAVIQVCRDDSGIVLDRAGARFALLLVIDHLPRALEPRALAELADVLPLPLALMLQRPTSADRVRFDVEDDDVVRAVCEVLARRAARRDLRQNLRAHVPTILLTGARPSEAELSSRPTRRELRAVCRPTVKVMAVQRPADVGPQQRPTRRDINAA